MHDRISLPFLALFLAGPLLAFGPEVRAQESAQTEAPDALQIHGFVSPGYLVTTHGNNFLADTADRGSFEFAEAGINFTKPLSENLRVGLQLFARDLGPSGNYSPKLDWFYVDYRYRDWLGFRAGRVKLPLGLYNDVSDVDSARVPILLPSSVYPASNRDVLLAQTGGELYGRLRAGPAGAFEYRLYDGTIFLDSPGVKVPYVVGGRILWETPVSGLRTALSVQALRLEASLVTGSPPAPVTLRLNALLAIASIEYSRNDLLIAAEYARWHLESTSNVPAYETNLMNERSYVMTSYRFGRWFQPGLYYSRYFPEIDERSKRSDQQHDVAATLRFDVDDHWLIKLEGHYMNGTAGLSQSLNEKPLADLPREWGVFLVKTSAYF